MSSKLSERYKKGPHCHKKRNTKKASLNTTPFKAVISFLENKTIIFYLSKTWTNTISIMIHTDFKDYTCIICLGGKCPYTLSHLCSSTNSVSENSLHLWRAPHLKMSNITSQLEGHHALNKDETPVWSWELAFHGDWFSKYSIFSNLTT